MLEAESERVLVVFPDRYLRTVVVNSSRFKGVKVSQDHQELFRDIYRGAFLCDFEFSRLVFLAVDNSFRGHHSFLVPVEGLGVLHDWPIMA